MLYELAHNWKNIEVVVVKHLVTIHLVVFCPCFIWEAYVDVSYVRTMLHQLFNNELHLVQVLINGWDENICLHFATFLSTIPTHDGDWLFISFEMLQCQKADNKSESCWRTFLSLVTLSSWSCEHELRHTFILF